MQVMIAQHPTQHNAGHFTDECFQAIDCTGTNDKSDNNQKYIKKCKMRYKTDLNTSKLS